MRSLIKRHEKFESCNYSISKKATFADFLGKATLKRIVRSLVATPAASLCFSQLAKRLVISSLTRSYCTDTIFQYWETTSKQLSLKPEKI